MVFRPFAASRETGRDLIAAGIPIDYLEALPREKELVRKGLHIAQLGGYAASKILELGDHHVRYVIAMKLQTERPSGVVISEWSFRSPWGHHINWDYDAVDVIPSSEHGTYRELLNSRLRDVLNEGRLLNRGRPVKGLLCGYAHFQSLPEAIRCGATVDAKLSITDDRGDVAEKTVCFTIDRRIARTQTAHARRQTVKPLFAERDAITSKGWAHYVRPRPVPRQEEFAPEEVAVAAD